MRSSPLGPACGSVLLLAGLWIANRRLPGTATVAGLAALILAALLAYLVWMAFVDRLSGGLYRRELTHLRRAFSERAEDAE